MKKKTRTPILFRGVKKIARIFKRKPTIINLNDEIEDQAIFISNHSAANGPFTLSLFFPKVFVPWGIHNMCGNYRERWKYLYFVFYRKKLGYGRIKSFLIATIFALFSKILYRWMRVVPTFTDMRLRKTMRLSIDTIEENKGILIFPENSDDGYLDVLEEYNAGFVSLAQVYYQRTNRDVPIYPIYFSSKDRTILIDRPYYVQDFVKQGLNRTQIADWFRQRTNELYQKIQALKAEKQLT